MSLTDLLLLIEGPDGKIENHIDMFFDRHGVMITCDKGEQLTNHEIHYALAVAFVHVGAELRGIILRPDDVAHLGNKLYQAFHTSYEGIKSIKEMNLYDFNKYMIKHGL